MILNSKLRSATPNWPMSQGDCCPRLLEVAEEWFVVKKDSNVYTSVLALYVHTNSAVTFSTHFLYFLPKNEDSAICKSFASLPRYILQPDFSAED